MSVYLGFYFKDIEEITMANIHFKFNISLEHLPASLQSLMLPKFSSFTSPHSLDHLPLLHTLYIFLLIIYLQVTSLSFPSTLLFYFLFFSYVFFFEQPSSFTYITSIISSNYEFHLTISLSIFKSLSVCIIDVLVEIMCCF